MYTPFRMRAAASLDVRAAERAMGVADTAGPRSGLAALIDGDLAGFTSRLPPALEQDTVAGLGPAAPLDGLGHPFALASRALDAALALGLSGLVGFAELGVLAAVLADDDVSRPLREAIITPVLNAGRSGATILATVRLYMENDRRLNETARELHTHVNTIRNRLARFEELTGRDLRRSEDLVETWWALQRDRSQSV
jgi:DNA-binding PucR family transcriptional regulator